MDDGVDVDKGKISASHVEAGACGADQRANLQQGSLRLPHQTLTAQMRAATSSRPCFVMVHTYIVL